MTTEFVPPFTDERSNDPDRPMINRAAATSRESWNSQQHAPHVAASTTTQQEPPQMPLTCEEMATLRMALHVIVLKERFRNTKKRQQLVNNNDKVDQQMSNSTTAGLRTALSRVTELDDINHPILVNGDENKGNAGDNRNSARNNNDSGSDHSSSEYMLSKRHSKKQRLFRYQLLSSSTGPTTTSNPPDETSLIVHDTVQQWMTHVQHILRMIWRHQPAEMSTAGTMNQRCYSLCIHVACQISQALSSPPWDEDCDSVAQKGVVSNWIRVQLTSFRFPSYPTVATVTTDSTGTTTVDSDVEEEKNVAWWWTIWYNVLRAQPLVLSELLVPILLDLLLDHAPVNENLTKASETTDNGSKNLGVVGLDAIHILSLLELSLESASAPTVALVEETLSRLPTSGTDETAAVNNLHESNQSFSFIPAVNTSWFCTQDMAYDYYLHHQQKQRCSADNVTHQRTTIGQGFLLVHGLSSLSEVLASKTIPKSANNAEQSASASGMTTKKKNWRTGILTTSLEKNGVASSTSSASSAS